MLKVLIADDEVTIRNGLKKMIQSYKLDLEVVGEAADGELALDFAKKYKPDLLLADINMPFLNGLDFLEKVRDILPDSLTIIISGYDEFEYARRALKLGVFDYLLKPINRQKLFECILKAISKYNERIREKEYLNLSRKEFEENKMFIQENFLRICLEKELEQSFIKDKLERLEIDNQKEMGLFIIIDKAMTIRESLISDESLSFLGGYSFYKDEYLIGILKLKGKGVEEIKNHLNAVWVRKTGKEIECSCGVLQEGIYSLYNTFQNLLSEHRNKAKLSGNISLAVNYIKDNYTNPDINLQTVADKCYVSPSCLTRIMQHKIGLSFTEYLTELRINKAIELLESYNTDISICEIARNVGYSSQHYFSRIFKIKTGLSPKEYKKNQL